MTELFINGNLIEDIEAEIAMTLTNFKLDSLGTRKGSFSNTFDLAKTNQTRLIFENCEIVTSLTSIPYRVNSCQIFIDGQLVVDGSAVIRETKDNYKVFISAGNSDFFKAISGKKIKDVDLKEYDHEYNTDEVIDRRTSTEGFLYPNIDYGFFEQQDLNLWNSTTIQDRQRFFQPSMWIDTIILKAIDEIGYTLQGDILNAQVFTDGILLCRSAEAKLGSNLAQYRVTSLNDFSVFVQGNNEFISKLSFTTKVSDDLDLYQFDDTLAINQSVYTPPISDNTDLMFVILFLGKASTDQAELYSNTRLFLDLIIYDDDGTIRDTITRSKDFGQIITVNDPLSFFDGTIVFDEVFDDPDIDVVLNNTSNITTLRFGWQIRSDIQPNGIEFTEFEFSINQVPRVAGQVGSVKRIEAAVVLPQSETIGDLLITISNLEGLTFQVNESTKVVNTIRIDRLQENKGRSLDWSGKIDFTDEPEIKYTIDAFAQTNLYQFADDNKDVFLADNIGQGVITVDNENLDRERIFFKSKFAPVPVVNTFKNIYRMGKVFTGDKYTQTDTGFVLNEKLKIDSFTPRIAIVIESETNILKVTPDDTTETNWIVNPLALSFDRSIFRAYNLIRSVLVNTKVVKALFLLDVQDITGLDFTIPIYVDHFGEFFYIESINQFKVNKRESCFITLVRI